MNNKIKLPYRMYIIILLVVAIVLGILHSYGLSFEAIMMTLILIGVISIIGFIADVTNIIDEVLVQERRYISMFILQEINKKECNSDEDFEKLVEDLTTDLVKFEKIFRRVNNKINQKKITIKLR